MALINLTESQKLWHFNIVLVLVVGVLFIAQANPISETFSCNQDRVCKLETSYFLPPLNRTKTYKLNVGACLEPMEYYHASKNSSYYTYNLGLDNREGKTIKIFRVPSYRQRGSDYSVSFANDAFKNEIALFNKYKKEPQRQLVIKNKADAGDFAFWLYTWVIFMTVLMIWNILDKNKGAT